jgi:hypothetical protein
MEYVIAATEKHVAVWSKAKNSIIFEENFTYIYSITLSSTEQYVQILDKIDSN